MTPNARHLFKAILWGLTALVLSILALAVE